MRVIGKEAIDTQAAESHGRASIGEPATLQRIKPRTCLSCHFR